MVQAVPAQQSHESRDLASRFCTPAIGNPKDFEILAPNTGLSLVASVPSQLSFSNALTEKRLGCVAIMIL